jgi:type IV pilus biogenesis/stability protein PilW
MKKGVWLLALAVLAGCADMRTGGSADPTMSTPVVESEARSRAKVFAELGFAYFNRGQMKVALDEARKAISIDSRYGPAYHLLGLIYMELEEDKLAEENFLKALDMDRADSDTHNSYGWFLCTRGRYDEGLSQFTEAIRNPLYDKPELAMANSGLCSEKKGDMKRAESYYNKALKLAPNAPLPMIKLADLSFRMGNMNEAQRLLARHQQVSPPTAEALWLGLRIERKLGDRAQEAVYNQQLRRNFPEAPETQLLLRGQYE